MPELPEVETVRLGLSRRLPGKVIRSIDIFHGKAFDVPEEARKVLCVGASVVEVRRRGKVLIVDLSTEYSLLIHLKMTGQVVFVGEDRFAAGHPNDSLVSKLPDNSTRVIFKLEDGSHVYFNDQRKFGWIRLVKTSELPEEEFLKRLGPEPINPDISLKDFKNAYLKRPNMKAKAALLSQDIVAGVGNIYADESLWAAKLHPEQKMTSLTDVDFANLHKGLLDVLKLSIERGGSSNHTYVNADGVKGSFSSFAKVFRREGQPCFTCGTEIIKTRSAGRGTHTCPTCQVAP
jgi:formamidopyrimidine-DNA glycosylase